MQWDLPYFYEQHDDFWPDKNELTKRIGGKKARKFQFATVC